MSLRQELSRRYKHKITAALNGPYKSRGKLDANLVSKSVKPKFKFYPQLGKYMYGCLAREPIRKNTLLGLYVGRLYQARNYALASEYALEVNGWVIDARSQPNAMARINDFRNLADGPNARVVGTWLNCVPLVELWSSAGIEPGQEIFCDFGAEWYEYFCRSSN